MTIEEYNADCELRSKILKILKDNNYDGRETEYQIISELDDLSIEKINEIHELVGSAMVYLADLAFIDAMHYDNSLVKLTYLALGHKLSNAQFEKLKDKYFPPKYQN